MTVITLVRHGQTDWNLLGRVQGRTDIPLNDTGREQARAAAEALRDGGYTAIVASPLTRAKETAEIIANALGLAHPVLFDGLVERDYASAEGLTAEDLSALRRRAMGADAETDEDVAARAVDALRSAATAHADAGSAGPLIAVAHGGLIRVLIAVASGGELPREGDRVENGSQHAFRFDADGFALLSSSAIATEA
ncbi:histidine phosphatase family protein [Microbacterium betulae]|uniref:Histidine phosphatase family protein n=1 Tax=Microbacterium betulae TaxID=2981139 RepID=A0AA97FJL3_9MICO|nr:histidine phosphatase family protein [Microbacterium sp. AB]WOF24473.1 histidine phosphatase family protein [Microbacterium sp. AB]